LACKGRFKKARQTAPAPRCSWRARYCAALSANIRGKFTPFLIAVSVVTLLLVFVPGVVLFVPDLIFGKD